MPEAQPQKGHRAAWTGAAAETIAQPPTSTDSSKSLRSKIAIPSLRRPSDNRMQRSAPISQHAAFQSVINVTCLQWSIETREKFSLHSRPLVFQDITKQAVPVRTMTLLQSFIQLGERFMTVLICDISNHFRNRKREVVSIPYSTIKRGLCGDSISPSLINSI